MVSWPQSRQGLGNGIYASFQFCRGDALRVWDVEQMNVSFIQPILCETHLFVIVFTRPVATDSDAVRAD